MSKNILLTSLIMVFSFISEAQIKKDDQLFIELKKQDSIFFEKAFNQCDLDYLEKHIANDLKFYHDQSGFQDKKSFLENTRKYICSNQMQKPIRKVNANSLELFKLSNDGVLYGVIQKGVHNFYLREANKDDMWTSTAKFTHVWLKKNEDWVLAEALSYDHQSPDINSTNLNNIEKLLEKSNVPAMGLGIIENGKLTKVEVYGTLDKIQKAPYNTIFKVASLTKPVFALTVLKLIDAGLLKMDEPLHQYWIDPEIKNDKRYKKLTPYLVLTHQTGFPNWRYLTNEKKLHFQFEPGTKYQYSGEGFEYLRKAIEIKLNKTLEELAQQYVFKPIGMHDTHFWWDNKVDEERYAQNYDDKGNTIDNKKYFEANAAANLLTTVEDYGSFIAYLTNGAQLSSSLFNEIIKQQTKLRDNDFFGLGWEILTGFSNDEYCLIHTGKDPGVSTLAVFFPKTKNGYLIFLNGDNVNEIYENVLNNKVYLGNELWDKR
ncbi:DUF4440 domain-containing protein [Flavobacterium piscinae]|uniref:DUF4440 domain-containing protein n=1 Tax=Flavobacterium piscinae TaxID=2506424 RepID=A0A4Q1KWY2_9FLAO|nr:serine hydrolase [Flavobacterium piscinae]RXR34813.1 DUF4440 domain-containing protein [Flavobacterium piscinae]